MSRGLRVPFLVRPLFEHLGADDKLALFTYDDRLRTVLDLDAPREQWNAAPNVLSVDTEGFDLPILRSIDFKRFRPDVIVAETGELGGHRLDVEILEFLVEQGYQVRGGSFVNTVFVDRRHIK